MVTARFKWRDGRCVEQVTYADASGLHVEYRVNGLVIATAIPLPEPTAQIDQAAVDLHPTTIFTPAVNNGETVNVLPAEVNGHTRQESSPQASDAAADPPAAAAPEQQAAAEASEQPAVADPFIPPAPPDDSAVGGTSCSPGDASPVATAQPLIVGAAPSALPEVSRIKAANIRGMWAGLFGTTAAAASEGISYAITNLTSVNLAPGIGLLIGAGLTGAFTAFQYWTKKYAKPDGTW